MDDVIWIKDSELGFRLCKIIENYGAKILVKFCDENGIYQQVRFFFNIIFFLLKSAIIMNAFVYINKTYLRL